MMATVAPAVAAPPPGPAGPEGPGTAPLTLLVGPPGIGRTRALRALRQAAEAAGGPVLEVRLAAEDRDEPWHLAGRVLANLAPLPARLAAGRGRGTVEPSTATLSRALRRHRGLTVFIDDAQWVDPHSATTLLAALHGSDENQVRCVAALRSGSGADLADGVPAAFHRLRAAGLVRIVAVRPVTPVEADTLAAEILNATPYGALRGELRRLSRGRPAALLAAARGYQGSPAVRVLDRRAYLIDPAATPGIPADDPLLDPVRQLTVGAFATARAVAVLQPLGSAVPALAARATGRASAEVDDDLAALRAAGVANECRRGWRITVPAVAVALTACLGPYERRRLAQVAVEAIWSGAASCAEPGFLPDQTAIAGRLVDPHRATALLRECAQVAEAARPTSAARWWAAAAELSAAPQDRVEALLAEAAAALHAGRGAAARPPLTRLLGEEIGWLSPAARQEAELLELVRVAGVDDAGTAQAVAAGEPWRPGSPRPSTATRAAALGLLDRWAEAADLLAGAAAPDSDPGSDPGATPVMSPVDLLGSPDPLTDMITAQVAVATGRAGTWRAPDDLRSLYAPADSGLSASTTAPGDRRRQVTAALGRYRLAVAVGDSAAADAVLVEAGLNWADLPAPERCLSDWQRGRWTAALDAAQASVAAGLAAGRLPAPALVHRAGAEVLLGRGWPMRARAMLRASRGLAGPLTHLAASAAAEVELTLGDAQAAAGIAEAALAAAARSGALIGTDELWMVTAELAALGGDRAGALAAAEAATAVAAALGSAAARLWAASARLVAGHDLARAAEVVGLARDLGRPYELARALERAVRWTGRHPELLAEAYDLYDDLGAILHRSRVRQAMREHGVAVPGRADTLAEGEQLLAALVAEGLSNRQLAAVTQSSAKSVEGRLSRLFTRAGYQSRVELAAAVLVGDYRVD
ncbi:AAA family ATPase [Micromonospora sp. LOL_023]|uniref:AAA family ATPase n=1 Tax=Micromonospora sp. LOL_023 TaxID=3345418 RepID=UPI003A88F1E7